MHSGPFEMVSHIDKQQYTFYYYILLRFRYASICVVNNLHSFTVKNRYNLHSASANNTQGSTIVEQLSVLQSFCKHQQEICHEKANKYIIPKNTPMNFVS